jgi:excisionase family DNA binding protein
MADIMTTKELAGYLRLHEITICKYAGEGVIPAVRIGRVWRFDKGEIDKWINESRTKPTEGNKPTGGMKPAGEKKPKGRGKSKARQG